MNFILVRTCNNCCPYCFETTERQVKGKPVTLENVTKIASWASRARLDKMSLLGGEPFLHPDLGEIVDIFRSRTPNTKLTIFTGGIFRSNLLDRIDPESAGIVFNVNEPRDYRSLKHFNKVINNIEKSIKKGFRVVLGFNVWRSDFDWHFMPDMASHFARDSFRWTIANPQLEQTSNVISPKEYSEVAGNCLDMLHHATQLKIEALLDCPLPLCFFKPVDLGWIRQYHPNISKNMGFCDPSVDVTPELEAIRCFALASLSRVNVLDFADEYEIQDWFRNHIDARMINEGIYHECADCPHLESGRCQGGCLAWSSCSNDVGSKPPTEELAVSMHDLISKGDYASAMARYRNSSYWVKTAVPTYLAALSAYRLDEPTMARKLAQHSLSLTQDRDLRNLIVELIQAIPGNLADKYCYSTDGN